MNRLWPKEDDAVVKAMIIGGSGIDDICAAFPTRTRKAVKMRIQHIRQGSPSRSMRIEQSYIPSPTELRRLEEMKPITDVMRLWGHITRTGQLRPIVKVELEAAA